jgi:hypothetical protein
MTPNIINGKKELPSFERELVDGFQGHTKYQLLLFVIIAKNFIALKTKLLQQIQLRQHTPYFCS